MNSRIIAVAVFSLKEYHVKLSNIYTSLFCGVMLPCAVYASETSQKPTALDEISVLALRDPSAYAVYANNTQTLEQETLRRQQPTSVADSLKYLPNVDIQGGSRALAQKPMIRGLGGNRVVQIIDGVRQNFDLAHRGAYFMPASLLQEVEVVKGPSSTLWGSGALGGVVAMRTANALDLLKNGDTIGAQIQQGYQSANQLSSSSVAVFGADRTFDWLLQGFYNDSNDLRVGGGEKIAHSGLMQKGGLAKFGWQINEAQRLELSHRGSVSKQTANSNNETATEFTDQDVINEIGNFHRNCGGCSLEDIRKFYAENVHTRLGSVNYLSRQQVTDQSSALNYYLNPEHNPYLNMQVTLYHNRTEEKEQRVQSGLRDKTELHTTGLNIRNSSELAGINLTYGADYYRDKLDSQRESNQTDGKFRADSYTADSKVFGAYVLSHIQLSERWVLSPGLRYDRYNTQGGRQHQTYRDHHWSPALALTWHAADWLDITAKYSEAYRAPSMQERFVSGAHFGMSSRGRDLGNLFVANPNLKPETAENKEISADFHFDNVWYNRDRLTFRATYFQNDVKDFINLVVYKSDPNSNAILLPDRSQYRNVENARLRGFELESQYQYERLSLALGYAQTRGKDKNTHQPLSNIAADKFTFATDYELVKQKFNLGARVTHYAKQHRVPAEHGLQYGGYALLDFTASYAPLSGEWHNLRLDFAIENLLDKKYLPAFSLMAGSGRNFKLNVGYYF